MIIDLFLKGGFLMWPILFCSVLGAGIIISKFLEFRQILKEIRKPVDQLCESKLKILSVILERIKNNPNEQEISIIGTKHIRKIEKELSWLSVISTVTPLLGLTGTVTGMIKTFKAISDNPVVDTILLAGGIWEALITTAFGLLVAIPVHIFHHYLDKQLDEITFNLQEIATELLKNKHYADSF